MATIPLVEDVEQSDIQFEHEIQGDFAYRNNVHNANNKIRMGFLRKVYNLLSIQILVTIVLASPFFISSVKLYVQDNVWTMNLAIFLTVGVSIALKFEFFKGRDHLTNLILLGVVTLVQAYTVGVVTSMYDTTVVLKALFITLTILLSLTYNSSFQTKRDSSFLGFGWFIGLWCLILAGFMQIFIPSTTIELFISIGGPLLFLFIIFNMKHKMHTFSPEEYIWATITIYLGIINLFLHVLREFAKLKKTAFLLKDTNRHRLTD